MERVISAVADDLALSEAERTARYPNNRKIMFKDRSDWARTYLLRAGLLSAPARGYIQITKSGLDAVRSDVKKIDIPYLMHYPSFAAWKKTPKPVDENEQTVLASLAGSSPGEQEAQTPQETIEHGYLQHKEQIYDEILQAIGKCSPTFFENVVVDLIQAMGYGGFRGDAGEVTGKSGDEGIDGIIKEDKLGLDVIPLQAKRWSKGIVGESEIQKFVGALHGKGARKGIFITTSTFSDSAKSSIRLKGQPS